MSINRKRGSIALARSLCYEIAGAASEDDDISGSDYGSVDVAEILSAEVERLRETLAQPEQCKPLTAASILNMMPSSIPAEYDGPLMEFARAIEQALKERIHD